MKNKNRLVCSLLLCLVIGSGVHLFTGCDAADGTDGLTVSPSSVNLSPSSQAVVFTASMNATNDLALPMEWSVSNPDIGYIVSSSGNQAVYQASNFSKVDNVITARDQYGNEGFATTHQGSSSSSTGTTTTTSTSTTTTTTGT